MECVFFVSLLFSYWGGNTTTSTLELKYEAPTPFIEKDNELILKLVQDIIDTNEFMLSASEVKSSLETRQKLRDLAVKGLVTEFISLRRMQYTMYENIHTVGHSCTKKGGSTKTCRLFVYSPPGMTFTATRILPAHEWAPVDSRMWTFELRKSRNGRIEKHAYLKSVFTLEFIRKSLISELGFIKTHLEATNKFPHAKRLLEDPSSFL